MIIDVLQGTSKPAVAAEARGSILWLYDSEGGIINGRHDQYALFLLLITFN